MRLSLADKFLEEAREHQRKADKLMRAYRALKALNGDKPKRRRRRRQMSRQKSA